MNKFKSVAIEAALAAGQYQKSRFGKKHTISYKGKMDLLTEVDKKSESIIASRIKKAFPGHALQCEEGTNVKSSSGYTWFVDPLDGTTNFAHNFPVFCTSIALQKGSDMILGVVYAPMLDKLFWAARGKGAYAGKKRIKVSAAAKLGESLLATGFPYWIRERKSPETFGYFKDFILSTQAVRRPGSAAIDLCYVAEGAFDGFWEQGLKPWDIAAGALIVEEAGGRVTDFRGKKFDLYGEQILATNGLLHGEMMRVLSG